MNVFEQTLKILNVKHTHYYAERVYSIHPNKNNLWGIAELLAMYGVDSVSLRLKKADDIFLYEPPFIAHVRNDFAIITSIQDNKVVYRTALKKRIVDKDDFFSMWSGVIMTIEKRDNATEPNYKMHLFKSWYYKIIPGVFCFLLALLCGNLTFLTNVYSSLLLILSCIGGYICFLLYCTHNKISSVASNRICTLASHSDCSSSKETFLLANPFSLPEIGLSYFLAIILCIIIFPQYVNCLCYFNLTAFPFTLASFYYQKFIQKKWCLLCIITQLILWGCLICDIIFIWYTYSINNTGIDIIRGVLFVLMLWIGIFSIITTFITPFLLIRRKEAIEIYKSNLVKSNSIVLASLLKSEQKYQCENISSIFIGTDTASHILTIISNPYCTPCSVLHSKLEKLIATKKDVKIQYIFTFFKKKLSEANMYLISACLNKSNNKTDVLNTWYRYGKLDIDFFKKKYGSYEIESSKIEADKQKAWCDMNSFYVTPTILFNGIKLPDLYEIEDLYYIL